MRHRLATAVLIAACTTTGEGDGSTAGSPVLADGIRYTASTAVLESFPVQLHTTLRLTNTTADVRRVELPSGCVFFLLAHRTADPGTPAWDQSAHIMCTMALQTIVLQPGEQQTFTTRTDAREILGDSLPDGTWFLTARVQPTGAAAVLVPAGTAQLAVPR